MTIDNRVIYKKTFDTSYKGYILDMMKVNYLSKIMEKDTEQLGQKLDTIIALLLRMVPRNVESISLKDQIRILTGIGVRPVDIARITGKTQSHINKELASIRKEK